MTGTGAGHGTDVVPSFDQSQAQVQPGGGIVARFPGILAVSAAVSPDRAGVLNRFLTICSEVSAAGARAPGRRLSRQLAAWLAQLDEAPTLGTVSPTEGGLAIFLSGRASMLVGPDGPRYSGEDSASWLDRIVEWPDALALSVAAEQGVAFTTSVFDLRQGVVPGQGAILATLRPAASGHAGQQETPSVIVPPAAAADPVTVQPVIAQSVTVEPVMAEPAAPPPAPAPVTAEPAEPVMAEPPLADVAVADAPIAPAPTAGPAPAMAAPDAGPAMATPDAGPAEQVVPPPAEQVVPPPPQVTPAPDPMGPVPPVVGAPIPSEPRPPLLPPIRSARIFGAQQQEPPRPPLPLPSVAGEPIVQPESDGTPKVQGFLCSRGHLNDPRGLFCGICGIRMAERTGILTIGRRPPLGLLVFDDGVTFTVDADYLLGREPDVDPRVRHGGVRPLVVVDRRGAVSRRHAEIRLDGWVVLLTDIGSANGTFIAPREQQIWSALIPQQPVPLEAGTRVRLGSRMFVFESPHGAP